MASSRFVTINTDDDTGQWFYEYDCACSPYCRFQLEIEVKDYGEDQSLRYLVNWMKKNITCSDLGLAMRW